MFSSTFHFVLHLLGIVMAFLVVAFVVGLVVMLSLHVGIVAMGVHVIAMVVRVIGSHSGTEGNDRRSSQQGNQGFAHL